VWLVVLAEARAAEQLTEDLVFMRAASGAGVALEVLYFPEGMPDGRDMREAFSVSADRQTVLSRLRARRSAPAGAPPSGGSTLVVVTTPVALAQPVPALEAFAEREVTLQRGQRQGFQALLERLRELDYDCEAVCESPGHYAIRGGIIDVYPITASEPYRLDFFGDEIEEIRAFDPVTQRSGASVESIALSASPRLRLATSQTGIADYLPRGAAQLALIEPAGLDSEWSALARDGWVGLDPLRGRRPR
jgi:transcription-repair coupling factor (superfamily II helicase)